MAAARFPSALKAVAKAHLGQPGVRPVLLAKLAKTLGKVQGRRRRLHTVTSRQHS